MTHSSRKLECTPPLTYPLKKKEDTWNICLFVILIVRILGPSDLQPARSVVVSLARRIHGISEGRDAPTLALSFVDLWRSRPARLEAQLPELWHYIYTYTSHTLKNKSYCKKLEEKCIPFTLRTGVMSSA